MKTSSSLRASTILCGIAAIATPAVAQQGPNAPMSAGVSAGEPQDGGQTTPDAQATPDTGAIRDIVVTAQRRADNIQTVPVAVTALDQTMLESATIKDVRELSGRVPSLVIDTVGAAPSAAAISIRGISFEDLEKSFDPAVGVAIDGVFVGTNTGQLLDSFDLERLEVLRGPQGTLFGRNTIGGVISVTRTRPTEDFGVRGTASYANYDTKRGRLMLNTGKLGGIIALKGYAFYDDTEGYYFNATKNHRDGAYETLTYGATALITPSDAITAQVNYEHYRERGETVLASQSQTGSDVVCAAPGAPGFPTPIQCNRVPLKDHGLYTTFTELNAPVTNDTDSVTGNIDIELGKFTLTSVTGYRTNGESVTQDFDGTSILFYETVRAQDYEQFSQEVRLVGDVTDRINLLLGGYYFTSNYQLRQTTNLGAIIAPPTGAQTFQFTDHHARSYAGFADVRFKVTDAITLGVGGRYTEDKKRIFNTYARAIALVKLTVPTFTGFQCTAASGTFSPAPGVTLPAYAAANNCSGQADFGKFTWRANANYQIDPHKLAYLSYSTGFRSGGFNGRAGSPTSLGPYQPESVKAYELGLKADWLDRTLRTNVALYRTTYSNKQEEIIKPFAAAPFNETVVANASAAKIYGAELEVIAQPSQHFSFNGSFTYTHARYTNFFSDVIDLQPTIPGPDGVLEDVSTLTLRRAPTYQWSAGFDYTHPIGAGTFDFNTLLRFQGKYLTCITPKYPRLASDIGNIRNDPRCATEDREDLSAQISYTLPAGSKGELKLSLFGRNLTDHRGLASTVAAGGLFASSGAVKPRTYGIEAGFKF